MSLPPSNNKLLRLRSVKLPHLTPKPPLRAPTATVIPRPQPNIPQQGRGGNTGGGVSEDQIRNLLQRVGELEAEAENRREFDDTMYQNLVYVMEVALTTEHYFAVEGPVLTIKTGDSKIVLKPNGDITIDAKNITIKGSGDIRIRASGEVEVKGSKILQN